MIPAAPLIPDEVLEEARVLTNKLASALKSARAKGENTGNPLEEKIRVAFDSKRDELLTRPLYLQVLFVIGSDGLEDTSDFINSIIDSLKEEPDD